MNAHTAIAERVLGRPLPKGAQVHHVDGNGKNNNHMNLVICPSAEYHKLLHRRTDALDGCGNADYLKCDICGQWDDPKNMYLYLRLGRKSPRASHRHCRAAYLRHWRK